MSLYCYCKRTESPPYCDGSHALPRPRPTPENATPPPSKAETTGDDPPKT